MSATKGPWVFERGNVVSVNQDDCYIGGKRPVVCNVNLLEPKDDLFIGCGGNATDNGKILAAAWEALEACRIVKQYLVKLENGTPEDDPLRAIRAKFHKPLHDALDAALVKAEGRNA